MAGTSMLIVEGVTLFIVLGEGSGLQLALLWASGSFQPGFLSGSLGKLWLFTSCWFCRQCQKEVCPVDLKITLVFVLPAEQGGLPCIC